MDSKYFSMLDMAIAGVPVILVCVWQLISVNREIAKDKAARDLAATADAESPDGAGHPIGEHRLDDR